MRVVGVAIVQVPNLGQSQARVALAARQVARVKYGVRTLPVRMWEHDGVWSVEVRVLPG